MFLSESATAQWMLGSPRGETVSPSAQKELEVASSYKNHGINEYIMRFSSMQEVV